VIVGVALITVVVLAWLILRQERRGK